jgi:hypothetical protein
MGHPAAQAGYTALLMMDIIVPIAQGRGWAPFLEPHTVPKDYAGRCCGCNLINSELFPIGVAAQYPLHPLILIWMAGDVFVLLNFVEL